MLARFDLRRLGLATATAIALLGALGIEHALARTGGPFARMPLFGLDAEWSVPASFSGGLLVGAAIACWTARRAGAVPPTAALGLASVFGFMAVDEVVQIHERLEGVANANWQIVYLPVMALAGGLWLLVLRALRGLPRWMLAGGAVAWVVAQLFEVVQRNGAVLVHRWTILPEELLEMSGSALFAFALLLAARRGAVERKATARLGAAVPVR